MPSVAGSLLRPSGVTGASLSLFGSDGVVGMMWSAGVRARELDGLQLTVGEGPAHTSFTEGRVVQQPDLPRPAPVGGRSTRSRHSRSASGRCSASRCSSAGSGSACRP